MLKRRQMVSALAAAIAGAVALPGSIIASAAEAKRKLPWRNWSGSQQCLPEARVAPGSVPELQQLLRQSSSTVRPVGAGHSFSPLVPTDGTIVSLSRLGGVLDHDSATLQATIGAGTRLGDIGQPLDDLGQALINMPDIDEQALAGCLATATHGTGAGIGCMSTFVTGLQIADARGDLIDCSADQNPQLFEAAKVSLGALGVVTQVTLQNVAPYRLKRQTVWRSFEEILEIAPELAKNHRNFEFYYIPFSGMGFTDVHDITDEPVASTERLDGNDSVEQLELVRDWLEWSPGLREFALGSYMKTLSPEQVVASSWQNYASERNVRFNEMEYHLPVENGLQAVRDIREAIETHHHDVFFPIEVRFVKGDDIWLSPFYQRDSCSIAVHRVFDEDFAPFFKTLEPILRGHGGRPHWGKINTLSAADFRALYPRWDEFLELRREFDPQERFLNPYLKSLFA
ncbi:MAG: D-arabinono-1,4-lactone oxidase [Halioglobus sp.]